MRMLQAANGRAAAVKFQTPMFERCGAKGFEALERARVLYAARQMGVITIVDCLRGGLSTTISAIADAWLQARCTVAGRRHHAAAVLWRAFVERPDYRSAGKRTRRVHRLLTSNPEGMSLQTALRQSGDYKGRTVAYGIASTAQKHNVDIEGMGSVGLIIGATIGQWMQDSGVDPPSSPVDSFPGYGWRVPRPRI